MSRLRGKKDHPHRIIDRINGDLKRRAGLSVRTLQHDVVEGMIKVLGADAAETPPDACPPPSVVPGATEGISCGPRKATRRPSACPLLAQPLHDLLPLALCRADRRLPSMASRAGDRS